jgi:glutathione S-transferase
MRRIDSPRKTIEQLLWMHYIQQSFDAAWRQALTTLFFVRQALHGNTGKANRSTMRKLAQGIYTFKPL